MTEDIDQHRDKRQKVSGVDTVKEESIEVDARSRPTNHERQPHPGAGLGSSSNAEANTLREDQQRPSSHDASLEQLQKDMGEAFLICKSSKTLSPAVPPLVTC